MLIAAPFGSAFGDEPLTDIVNETPNDGSSFGNEPYTTEPGTDGPVTGEPAKKSLTILRATSESLFVKEGTGEIVFKGSVAAVALTNPSSVVDSISAAEAEEFLLCTDLLTVNVTESGGRKNIKSVAAIGSVVVIQSNRVIRGANALYDKSTALVRVLGNARIEECSNVVEGTEVVLDITDDTARVEGGMTATVRTLIGVEANHCVIDDFFKLKSGELSGRDICTKFKEEL